METQREIAEKILSRILEVKKSVSLESLCTANSLPSDSGYTEFISKITLPSKEINIKLSTKEIELPENTIYWKLKLIKKLNKEDRIIIKEIEYNILVSILINNNIKYLLRRKKNQVITAVRNLIIKNLLKSLNKPDSINFLKSIVLMTQLHFKNIRVLLLKILKILNLFITVLRTRIRILKILEKHKKRNFFIKELKSSLIKYKLKYILLVNLIEKIYFLYFNKINKYSDTFITEILNSKEYKRITKIIIEKKKKNSNKNSNSNNLNIDYLINTTEELYNTTDDLFNTYTITESAYYNGDTLNTYRNT